MTKDEMIMKCVQEHYDELTHIRVNKEDKNSPLKFEVVALFLQGSQNYGVDIYNDEYKSDVDTKAIVLPSFNDFALGKMPYSGVYVRANDEHIDIKDVRCMFDMFKKQNTAYIELLFTKYRVVNPKYQKLVDELLGMDEAIARAHPNAILRGIAGTSIEKYKDLEHPYPTVMAKIEKFGYDPKQLHHILRLYDLEQKFVAGRPYLECLTPDDPEYLIKVKLGMYSLEEARALAKETCDKVIALKDANITKPEYVNNEVFNKLDTIKVKLLKQHMKEELFRGK